MSKDIAFDNDARAKMAAGVSKLADAVRVTIGPKGRYVAMEKPKEKPKVNVSNDGATVAANVDLSDPIENMGMKIVREAAIAANNDAGDGTTTATILADAIVSEGVRCVTAGSDPLALRRGINAPPPPSSKRCSKTRWRCPRATSSRKSPRCRRAMPRSVRKSPTPCRPSAKTASSPWRSRRISA